MKFTERELTIAIDLVAKQVHATSRMVNKLPLRRDVPAWNELTAFEKYQQKAGIGEAVLPALLALPERPTVGAMPSFSDAEYAEAANAAAQALLDARQPGAWDELSERKRKQVARSTEALARAAVALMPIRQDPDALIVPDNLGGLT